MKALFVFLSVVMIIIGTVFLIYSIRKYKDYKTFLIVIPLGCILFFLAGRYNLLWWINDHVLSIYRDQSEMFVIIFLPFLGWLITMIKNRKLRLIVSIIITILSTWFVVGCVAEFPSSCLIYLCMYAGFIFTLYSKIKKEVILTIDFFFAGFFGLGCSHLDEAFGNNRLERINIHGNTYWVSPKIGVLSSQGDVIISCESGRFSIYEKDEELYFISTITNEDVYILKIYDKDGNFNSKHKIPRVSFKEEDKRSINDVLEDNDFECLYNSLHGPVPDAIWEISLKGEEESEYEYSRNSQSDKEKNVEIEESEEESLSETSTHSYDQGQPYVPQYETRDEWVPCWVCHGSGECDQCHGTGQGISYNPRGGSEVWRCPSCNGSGRCYTCGGTRGHYEKRTYQVR